MYNNLIKIVISLFALIPSLAFGQDYTPKSDDQIIAHTHYTLSYSESNEQAIWVYYVLIPEMMNGTVSRTDDFREDKSVVQGSASLEDYKGSGYDRGHLAPAADMKFNLTSMSESFYLSNMSPQDASFNRGGWKKLEELVRTWCLTENKLYVVTGPIFLDNKGTIGMNNVTVPGYYYKIIYDPTDEQKMIGFIIPNEKLTNSLVSYVVTVDKIEGLTGIDFFSQLDDAIEDNLEGITNSDKWSFTVTSTSSSSSTSINATSVQCKGIAKSTGVRCKKKTTNPNGYCHYHQDQCKD